MSTPTSKPSKRRPQSGHDSARSGATHVGTTPAPKGGRPDPGGPDAALRQNVRNKLRGMRMVDLDDTPIDQERKEVRTLREIAVDHQGDHDWNLDAPLTEGKNAHRTNTPDEMRDALTSDHNWFEGDLRLDKDGTPVMSHDADATAEGLRLDEWLRVGRDSHRGLKVEIKQREALPKLLDALDRSGVPQERLMINVSAGQIDPAKAKEIRSRFPDAWIAITPATNSDDHFDEESLKPAIEEADAAGGKVTFPVRWDIASDDTIARLKPHGSVSIWTSRSDGTPDDAKAEKQRLMERGVDGLIDLGERSPWYQKLYQHARDVWDSDAVRGVRNVVSKGVDVARSGLNLALDGVSFLAHGAGSLLSGAGSLASDAGGAVKDGLSHVPVVGGLFD